MSKTPERNTDSVSIKKITFEVPLVIRRIKRDKMRIISVITEQISNVIILSIKGLDLKKSAFRQDRITPKC